MQRRCNVAPLLHYILVKILSRLHIYRTKLALSYLTEHLHYIYIAFTLVALYSYQIRTTVTFFALRSYHDCIQSASRLHRYRFYCITSVSHLHRYCQTIALHLQPRKLEFLCDREIVPTAIALLMLRLHMCYICCDSSAIFHSFCYRTTRTEIALKSH